MNFKTHLAFGLLIGLLLMNFFEIKWFIFFPLILLGALLPDIDHPNSKLGKKLGIFSKVFNFLLGHRGITHGIWIPVILAIVLGLTFGFQYGFPVAIGYLSHIMIDALTKQGVNILSPIAKLRLSGFIKTGGLGELVVFLLIIAGITVKIVGIIL